MQIQKTKVHKTDRIAQNKISFVVVPIVFSITKIRKILVLDIKQTLYKWKKLKSCIQEPFETQQHVVIYSAATIFCK